MRLACAAAALALAACGSGHGSVKAVGTTVIAADGAPGFPATRWLPAKPTYVLTARSIADLQRAVRDAADSIGALAGITAADVAEGTGELLGVDLFGPDSVAKLGLDDASGIALFSDLASPTIVVHLKDPAAFRRFVDSRKAPKRSQIVDGVEITTIELKYPLSWAVDQDWLWIHAALPEVGEQPTAWFTASHTPHAAAWADNWRWTMSAASPKAGVVGYMDVGGLVTHYIPRTKDLAECAQLYRAPGRVGVSVEGDGKHAGGKLVVELGSVAGAIQGTLLPPPPGWDATRANAPIAMQWNADVQRVAGALGPCMVALGAHDFDVVKATGIRAVRGMLLSLDLGAKKGAGAVSLDVAGAAYIRQKLDEIPGRGMLERDRSFGPYKGKHLSIPFGPPAFDYVVTDQVVLAAMGEDVLTHVIAGTAASAPPPVFALDVEPPALPAATWEDLFRALDLRHAQAVAAQLMGWRDIHFAIRVEGTSLVLAATGDRQ
ncbi:MAG TPA: hypothetical protein VGM88_18070 [Kofleriaceae bacterium]|jgi:hypothetical protein